MTSTESHNGVGPSGTHGHGEVRRDLKLGAKTITVPVDLVSTLPTVDLTRPVHQYLAYVQKAVELNRDLATAWAETVMSLSGVLREHAKKVNRIVKDETETVADLAREQVEQAAREQAEKDRARRARQAEREKAKQARERYEGLTKAKLSDRFAERELPRTGNVDELIERLVSADSE